MKNLSLRKVNQMCSGQTIFWVEASIDDTTMAIKVDVHEQLLQGKKFMLPAGGIIFYEEGPSARFVTKKGVPGLGQVFTVPTDLKVERWFFANRRSAVQAAEEVRAGLHPQVIQVLTEEAIDRNLQRQEIEAAAAIVKERGRQAPIRAWGESESTLDLRLHQAERYHTWREVQGRPFPQARKILRRFRPAFNARKAMEDLLDRHNSAGQHEQAVRAIVATNPGFAKEPIAASVLGQPKGLVKDLLSRSWRNDWQYTPAKKEDKPK